MIGVQKKNTCPRCGSKREPDNEVCPKCEFIFTRIKPAHENKEPAKEPKENLAETPKPDIPEIRLNPTLGNKRNFLYNLNTRTVNLVLFAVVAIVTGILLFKYIMMMLATPNG